jgi:hypothetical protein
MLNLNFYTLNKKTMTQSTYNGWTNYATWRVGLEFFDGFEYTEYYDADIPAYELSTNLRDLVVTHLETETSSYSCKHESTFVLSYALAFLDDVNWYELAEHLINYNSNK